MSKDSTEFFLHPHSLGETGQWCFCLGVFLRQNQVLKEEKEERKNTTNNLDWMIRCSWANVFVQNIYLFIHIYIYVYIYRVYMRVNVISVRFWCNSVGFQLNEFRRRGFDGISWVSPN